MDHKILYKASVRQDLRQINPKNAEKITSEIRLILGSNSRAGEALQGEFRGLFKLRIGEYRIIYALIEKDDVLILRIRHRSKAYE